MLSGLLLKNLRETGRVIALACLSLMAAMSLFVQILPQFEEGLNDMLLQVPFLRALISGLMGMDVGEGLAPQMLLVVVWSHPIVLTIVWALALVLCTRIPAGEIERGTIDVLLSWPVSRGVVYLAEVLVSLGGGLLLLCCGWIAFTASASFLGADLRPETGKVLMVLANLYALYAMVAAISQCIAAGCDRRGTAMGMAVAVVLASYLLQFLSTLWGPAGRLAFLSFVHYYQPAQVMVNGTPPWADVLVLAIGAAVLWSLGATTWRRRSVLTS